MGDLSRHFSRSEFACRCGCGFNTVDIKLLELLENVREHFNSPIFITSGCRCRERNKGVGGSPKSQHLIGRAADFMVDGCTPDEVATYLETLIPDTGGIGIYPSWTHVDSRYTKARW